MFILICLLSLYAQDNQAAWSSLSDWSESAYACVRSASQKTYQATAHCFQTAYNIGAQIYQKSKKCIAPLIRKEELTPTLIAGIPLVLKYCNPDTDDTSLVHCTECIIGMDLLCNLAYRKGKKAVIPAITLAGMVCGQAAGLFMPNYSNIIALMSGCCAYIGGCKLNPKYALKHTFSYLPFSALYTELLVSVCAHTPALTAAQPSLVPSHKWPKETWTVDFLRHIQQHKHSKFHKALIWLRQEKTAEALTPRV